MSKQSSRCNLSTRLWQLVVELDHYRSGSTLTQLASRLGTRRANLGKDLQTLQDMGVCIVHEQVQGELMYRLSQSEIPRTSPTPLELAAICLGRSVLATFPGIDAAAALDGLLQRCGSVVDPLNESRDSVTLSQIRLALRSRRRMTAEHRAERDETAETILLEPLTLRESEQQTYLFGYDVDRQDYRLLKVSRLAAVEVLDETMNDHGVLDVGDHLGRTTPVWTGDPVTRVVVRVAAHKANLVAENPLVPHQELEYLSDGSVLVRANVSSTKEALRWVLSWGREAEAIAPGEFRDSVRRELDSTVAHYARTPSPRRSVPVTLGRTDSELPLAASAGSKQS
jgi:predicted DNA-binding transcriptional regulator YafY